MRPFFACFLLLFACGSERERDFGPPRRIEDDKVVVTGSWRLFSFEVDVDLSIATVTSSISCATSAWLVVDTLTGSADRYELREAGCDSLEFTAEGDLIVLAQPTGVDWRAQDLSVDSGNDTITLGPVHTATVTYRLVLSAPPCEDDAECDCGRLSRFENEDESQLHLGRICD